MTTTSFGRTAAVLLLGLLTAGASHAVFRCGNVYQDRPCDDKGPQAHLTPGIKVAPAAGAGGPAAESAFAPACSRIGQEAQKIAWKREAGATQEKQMAELPNTSSRAEMVATIDSVYRKRGSAPEIRAAVEAECVAQKQQAADTAAAIRALQAQQGGAAPAAPPTPAASAAAPASPSTQKPTATTGPSSSCASWRADLDSINAEFRRGGSAVRMEALQNRRRDTEKMMQGGRC